MELIYILSLISFQSILKADSQANFVACKVLTKMKNCHALPYAMPNFNLPASLFFFQDRKQHYKPNVSLSIEVISEKIKTELLNIKVLRSLMYMLQFFENCCQEWQSFAEYLNNQDKKNNQNKTLNINTTHRNECQEWNI